MWSLRISSEVVVGGEDSLGVLAVLLDTIDEARGRILWAWDSFMNKTPDYFFDPVYCDLTAEGDLLFLLGLFSVLYRSEGLAKVWISVVMMMRGALFSRTGQV